MKRLYPKVTNGPKDKILEEKGDRPSYFTVHLLDHDAFLQPGNVRSVNYLRNKASSTAPGGKLSL